MKQKRKPFKPCEILQEEFMQPINLSEYLLAKRMRISSKKMRKILKGKRKIDIDIAIRLSRVFGTSCELWLNLQRKYDLWNILNKKSNNCKYDKIKMIATKEEINI